MINEDQLQCLKIASYLGFLTLYAMCAITFDHFSLPSYWSTSFWLAADSHYKKLVECVVGRGNF